MYLTVYEINNLVGNLCDFARIPHLLIFFGKKNLKDLFIMMRRGCRRLCVIISKDKKRKVINYFT